VDEVVLTTLAEFHHYPNRSQQTRHRGPWLPEPGEPPAWPAGNGKKVFACLKTFPALPHLPALLRQAACPIHLAIPPSVILRIPNSCKPF
jgi:hypothetical protein